MRSFRVVRFFLTTFLLLNFAAFAANETLNVKVKDQQGVPIRGAQVSAYKRSGNKLVSRANTSATGEVTLSLSNSEYSLEVNAPGFTPATLRPTGKAVEVTLQLAPRNDSVTVTAGNTLLTTEQSGASTTVIDSSTLLLTQPVDAADVFRTIPGAVVSQAGRRGGLSSMFLRGGDSTYTKVIIDGVPVNDAGGTFDFGVIPLDQTDRIEVVRGAVSTLYGSDAMTGVVQTFSTTGHTHTPELSLSASGGTFQTANGSGALAGAYKVMDYNLYASQFHTQGQGVNDAYSNSLQGVNLGLQVNKKFSVRTRLRHSNNRSGVPGAWNYNGVAVLPPDPNQFQRQNNILGSVEFTYINSPVFTQTVNVFEYSHIRLNLDTPFTGGCVPPYFVDCPYDTHFSANRAGADYRGEFAPRGWLRTVFGAEFEDEHASVHSDFDGFIENNKGIRRNSAGYVQQSILRDWFALTGGVRLVHNQNFGNIALPHFAASLSPKRIANDQLEFLKKTAFHFAYGESFKEPTFDASFGDFGPFGAVVLPNPNVKAERARSFEAGITQRFLDDRASISATYFHQTFRDQIQFNCDPVTFACQYINLNHTLSHGLELEAHFSATSHLSFDGLYMNNATQILFSPLTATDPLLQAGKPLLRRPRNSGNFVARYVGHSFFGQDVHREWGGALTSSFVGRRADSDFLFPPLNLNHANGYARIDLGTWVAVTHRVTAFANIENATNRLYQESLGYPALKANFRAGLRIRLGGD
jgi:vitamin B12 transporter